MKNKIIAAAGALGVAGSIMLAGAPAASATAAGVEAPPCSWGNGHFWCYNRPNIPVEWAGKVVGYLYGEYNWFTCRYEGDPNGGGAPHPNRWDFTTADNGARGFVRDQYIYDETNVLPPC
ncbi:hypothetical protein [Amycolatopsis sp. NPDC059657]|uniref:hypothetical protein n=1 Tax=Amycolatopsis sp. NPDC059657 TaxID=3346899 RepID=UPI00366BCE91